MDVDQPAALRIFVTVIQVHFVGRTIAWLVGAVRQPFADQVVPTAFEVVADDLGVMNGITAAGKGLAIDGTVDFGSLGDGDTSVIPALLGRRHVGIVPRDPQELSILQKTARSGPVFQGLEGLGGWLVAVFSYGPYVSHVKRWHVFHFHIFSRHDLVLSLMGTVVEIVVTMPERCRGGVSRIAKGVSILADRVSVLAARALVVPAIQIGVALPIDGRALLEGLGEVLGTGEAAIQGDRGDVFVPVEMQLRRRFFEAQTARELEDRFADVGLKQAVEVEFRERRGLGDLVEGRVFRQVRRNEVDRLVDAPFVFLASVLSSHAGGHIGKAGPGPWRFRSVSLSPFGNRATMASRRRPMENAEAQETTQ